MTQILDNAISLTVVVVFVGCLIGVISGKYKGD